MNTKYYFNNFFLIAIYLVISGCWFRTSVFGETKYSQLIGKNFILKVELYEDIKTSILWKKKHYQNTKWLIVNAGTQLHVDSIVTRLLPAGRRYYASCSFIKNNKTKQQVDLPLNQHSIILENIWSEEL